MLWLCPFPVVKCCPNAPPHPIRLCRLSPRECTMLNQPSCMHMTPHDLRYLGMITRDEGYTTKVGRNLDND